MTYSREVHKRCVNCTSDHQHNFTLKVIREGDEFWVAQGPWKTEEEAILVVDKTANMVEEQNEKHRA